MNVIQWYRAVGQRILLDIYVNINITQAHASKMNGMTISMAKLISVNAAIIMPLYKLHKGYVHSKCFHFYAGTLA